MVLVRVTVYFFLVANSEETGNIACIKTLGIRIIGAVMVFARLNMPVTEDVLSAFKIMNFPEKKTYDRRVDINAGIE